MTLSRLIYISEPQFDPSAGSTFTQLASIMKASVNNNRAADITGALAYEGSWFLQVLEGQRRAIWNTFNRISEDERHADVLLIEMSEVSTRMFGNWWMGLATHDANTAAAFAPYLHNGTLRADTMSGSDILSLMSALGRVGLRRELRAAA